MPLGTNGGSLRILLNCSEIQGQQEINYLYQRALKCTLLVQLRSNLNFDNSFDVLDIYQI